MSAADPPRYRVEYLVADPARSADALRGALAAQLADGPRGGAIAVAGDGTLIKVHLVTDRPEVAIAIGRAAGTLFDVIVEPRSGAASREHAA